MNALAKLILPQLLKYFAEHKDEVLAMVKAEALTYLKSIDADGNGKADIDETINDVTEAVAVAHRLIARGKTLGTQFGVKKA